MQTSDYLINNIVKGVVERKDTGQRIVRNKERLEKAD